MKLHAPELSEPCRELLFYANARTAALARGAQGNDQSAQVTCYAPMPPRSRSIVRLPDRVPRHPGSVTPACIHPDPSHDSTTKTSLHGQTMDHPLHPVLIAGFGSRHHGDDALGLAVARSAGRRLEQVADVVLDRKGQVTLNAVENRQLLIIVDAAVASEEFPAGSWLRMNLDPSLSGLADEAAECEAPEAATEIGVDAMLQRAKSLGRLPPVIWIYAMAGEFFTEEHLSPSVRGEAARLVRRIEHDVRAWMADHSPSA